ncbi:MAG: universal stress protein [Magnetococcales bacterium]|nr:universal stress protein [Magnetococcales bacterium]MBF0261722.1 universal stress protein [Magnetococcales bacterium]
MSETRPLLPTGRFSHILVATECSEYSRSAVALSVELAQLFSGRITAMYMLFSNPEFESIALEQLRTQELNAARSTGEMKKWVEDQGVACHVEIRRGVHPHREIIDAANACDADLVVMGRRGRRGLARWMVGDATARVVAEAPCKVLVVPRGATLWRKTILLATDGSRYSERAGVVATILARQSGIPLRVVSVVESKGNQKRMLLATEAVERVLEHAKSQDVEVSGEVLEGHPPADTLAAEALRIGADLVVSGSHGRTGIERVFLGSVVERLIGKVSCPVLAIKGG